MRCPLMLLVLLTAGLSACNWNDQVDDAATGRVSPETPQAGPDEPTAKEVARTYSRLARITAKPVLVDPQLAASCVGIKQEHLDDARKRAGPHAHTAIQIYMNELAAGAFRTSAATYPVGAVIVK